MVTMITSIRGAIENMLIHGASLLDSHLMTQYAISIAMAQKVLCNMVVTHTNTVKLIRLEMLFTTESVALIVSL